MFHIKIQPEWYGRPDSMASLLYQYRRFQDANYLIMESDNNFTGKVFIEIEMGIMRWMNQMQMTLWLMS